MMIEKVVRLSIDFDSDYFVGRAIEGVLGFSLSGDIRFSTREALIEFLTSVAQKYFEGAEAHGDIDDTSKIDQELGNRPGIRYGWRFVGNHEVKVEPGLVTLSRATEVCGFLKVTSKKTVTVDGEEFTREIVEMKQSSWYPSDPEEVRIYVTETEEVVVS